MAQHSHTLAPLFISAICIQSLVSCYSGKSKAAVEPAAPDVKIAETVKIIESDSFTDSRDNKVYKRVNIGGQIWMAENLNYNASESKCYDNLDTNCVTYGRLYDWTTAMALPNNCNAGECAKLVNAKHRGVCPEGWHIPSNEEWDALYRFIDGFEGTESPYSSPTAGKHLKTRSGWYGSSSAGGDDTYGFAALPGGFCGLGAFTYIGLYAGWWTASEGNADNAYYRGLLYSAESAYWVNIFKSYMHSVRCLKD